ncbi:MAG: protein kinase [Acidobacteria bacterium]|jgi:serine/threonine-protein kinase|nr:protein kinase [Acidobacteriota bacterium]
MTDEKINKLEVDSLLGHYRILKKIGVGGMGEVYLAQDSRLRRRVALKVLPESIAGDKDRLRRFEQEAFAASALNHPNILTIHEFGAEKGVHFLATEYVEGETLREKLNRGSVSLGEALDIVQQMAFALSAAHAAGIAHRDIKPENIMIRIDGIVKVLDFGLAKLIEKQEEEIDTEAATRQLVRTNPGVVMGTVSYMSPEQTKGKDVDTRTDIWSFGVVLYEMLSGRLPFEGETPNEYIASILKSDPLPLENENGEIPAELTQVVRKALRKDQDARYQTMKSLLADLKELREEIALTEKLERSVSPNRIHQTENQATQIVNAETTNDSPRAQTASSAEYIASEIKQHKSFSIAALVILFLAIGGLGYWFFASRASSAKQIESIAVMPFVNQSGNVEVEYLSDGMTETLINNLSQLPNLSVKARSSVFHFKGKEISPQTVGSELSVQAILNGRVIQRGDNLTLSLELVDARTGNQIWGEQYNRKLTDIVTLQTEIARDVSNKLKTKLSGADEQKVSKSYTQNTEAYQLYLKGRFYWNKRTAESLKKAIEYFNQAIEKDPSYALAYAGLADSYSELTWFDSQPSKEVYPKAKAAALRALELDDQLAEAHTALGQAKAYSDWDFAGAEIEYRRAIELNPNYPVAHYYYAEMLSQLGRHDEAIAEANRAAELDPLSPIVKVVQGAMYEEAGRCDESLEILRKAIEADKDFPRLHREIVFSYECKGMFDEAINEWQTAEMLAGELSAEDVQRRAAILRELYRKAGAKGYWQGRLELLVEDAKRKTVSPADFASIYAFLGEKEKTLEWLEKAYQQREFAILYIKISPDYKFLRDDSRFQDLMRRVGLPQ